MTFRDAARSAFKRRKEEQAEFDAKRAKKFAEEATTQLRPGGPPFQAIGPSEAILETDGIIIKAYRQYGNPYYKISVQCARCDGYGEVEVLSLADVGEVLEGEDEHLCPECAATQTLGYKETWQDRLIAALLEGLAEEQRAEAEDHYTF
jgi:hypothetical protein